MAKLVVDTILASLGKRLALKGSNLLRSTPTLKVLNPASRTQASTLKRKWTIRIYRTSYPRSLLSNQLAFCFNKISTGELIRSYTCKHSEETSTRDHKLKCICQTVLAALDSAHASQIRLCQSITLLTLWMVVITIVKTTLSYLRRISETPLFKCSIRIHRTKRVWYHCPSRRLSQSRCTSLTSIIHSHRDKRLRSGETTPQNRPVTDPYAPSMRIGHYLLTMAHWRNKMSGKKESNRTFARNGIRTMIGSKTMHFNRLSWKRNVKNKCKMT